MSPSSNTNLRSLRTWERGASSSIKYEGNSVKKLDGSSNPLVSPRRHTDIRYGHAAMRVTDDFPRLHLLRSLCNDLLDVRRLAHEASVQEDFRQNLLARLSICLSRAHERADIAMKSGLICSNVSLTPL